MATLVFDPLSINPNAKCVVPAVRSRGFTQAIIVIAAGVEGKPALAPWFVVVFVRAAPVCPLASQEAPLRVNVRLFPDESAEVKPEPSLRL
jgi:hypothetical protein